MVEAAFDPVVVVRLFPLFSRESVDRRVVIVELLLKIRVEISSTRTNAVSEIKPD